MHALISQKDGLALSVSSKASEADRILSVRLQGTQFDAAIVVGNEPVEGCAPLPDFLRLAADLSSGTPLQWRSMCLELGFQASVSTFAAAPLMLRVFMGSTSDDECDWQVNASLLLCPVQLREFADALEVA
ncbi:hypothetical protein [Pseudomonas sp. PH1b]|uniref:hypothetical protein n=1 Tax=Pseudomonas sp. PH1b TaxID=1397282 RepID=UPI00046A3136|nr:hypothetical protein [Pseudomonas sp. PH1b]